MTGSADVLSSRLVASDSVVTRQVDDELVLLDMETEQFFGLDRTGRLIWEVLTDSPTVANGIERLTVLFEVESDRLRADVERLVDELVAGGLAELRS